MFHRHTCQLFQSPRALGIPVSAVEKEAVVRQREAFLRSLSWKARLWAMIRNLHKDYSNWHAPLEGWDSFFYPQRFVPFTFPSFFTYYNSDSSDNNHNNHKYP